LSRTVRGVQRCISAGTPSRCPCHGSMSLTGRPSINGCPRDPPPCLHQRSAWACAAEGADQTELASAMKVQRPDRPWSRLSWTASVMALERESSRPCVLLPLRRTASRLALPRIGPLGWPRTALDQVLAARALPRFLAALGRVMFSSPAVVTNSSSRSGRRTPGMTAGTNRHPHSASKRTSGAYRRTAPPPPPETPTPAAVRVPKNPAVRASLLEGGCLDPDPRGAQRAAARSHGRT